MGSSQSKEEIPLVSGVEVLVEENDLKAASAVVAAAFCGSKTSYPEGILDWACGEELRTGEGLYQPLEDEPLEKRKKIFQWLAGFVVPLCHRAGLVLAVRDPQGRIVGVAVVESPVRSWTDRVRHGFSTLRAFLQNDPMMPPWDGTAGKKNEIPEEVGIKLKVVQTTMETNHKTACPEPHYYLWNLAVLPEMQKQGYSRKLLESLNSIADKENVPLYLETSGDRMAAFYAKFGYETKVNVKEIGVPDHPEIDPYNDKGGFHHMVRPPRILNDQHQVANS